MTRECSKTSGTTKALAATAAQLVAAADRVPFAGAALPRLALRRFTCQFGRHVEARGRLSERTLGRRKPISATRTEQERILGNFSLDHCGEGR